MNNTDHRYQLESPRLTGHRQQKTTCPECGRRHCFVRYVDTEHDCQYLADDVGRCDHEQSCAYHYKPAQYFADNPSAREHDATDRQPSFTPRPQPKPFLPLPAEYALRSHSPRSTFWQWMATVVPTKVGATTDDLQRVYDDYLVGATHEGDVIFWQIDEQGRVHGGHIMHYGPDGHRQGFQGWVHTRLIRQGLLPLDYQLHQCFFGQHLLTRRPAAPVCVVESEKTALVMATRYKETVWLASSGSGGLSDDKLQSLTGRRVVFFPDSGCLQKWQDRLRSSSLTGYVVSPHMERYPPNTDLTDLLL